MTPQTSLQLVALLGLGLLALGLALRHRRLRWGLFGGAFGAFAAATGVAVTGQVPAGATAPDSPLPDDATRVAGSEYTSSRACRACHPGEHATWQASYHRRMTQPASPEGVLGAFDGRTLHFQDRDYRVWREGDRFFGDMPAFGTDGSGERIRGEIVMTTGSHHLQAYWLPMPQGETARETRGRAVFAAHCQRCHGEGGEGGSAPVLVGLRLLPDEVMAGITDGHGSDAGPPALSDDDARALAAFTERIQFDGRLMQFPWVWAVDAGVWMHEENSFLQPAPEIEKDERPGDRWGYSCDECHSVRPRYGWQTDGSVADSAAVELGIACEACHGAGRAHVTTQQSPWLRYRARFAGEADDIVNPADLDKERASHVCAQCHADVLREDDGYLPYKPGDDLGDSVFFVRMQEPPYPDVLKRALDDEPTRLADSFWKDGTVRIAGRDFNGLLESPCYTRGTMSCLSCHRMHAGEPDDQLGPGMREDQACLQCHADKSDVQAHTHHAPESAGSRCYSCHMPHTTYGLMKAIRAHRVDSPSVHNEVESGRPNACNLCHLDDTLQQTADQLTAWYGQPKLQLPAPHDDTAAGVVWALSGDGVVRAVTAWHMGYEPALLASGKGWQAPLLVQSLTDDYVAVRFLAWRALTQHRGFEQTEFAFDASEAERAAFAETLRERARELARPFAGRAELVLDEDATLTQTRVLSLLLSRDTTEVRVAE